jgi:hypothetical protein
MEWYKGNLGLPSGRQICAEICRRRNEPLPENVEPSATVYTSGAGTRLSDDCKWISSLEWVLLVGRGLEASGWLNDASWRAKTHGVHHALIPSLQKILSILTNTHRKGKNGRAFETFFVEILSFE